MGIFFPGEQNRKWSLMVASILHWLHFLFVLICMDFHWLFITSQLLRSMKIKQKVHVIVVHVAILQPSSHKLLLTFCPLLQLTPPRKTRLLIPGPVHIKGEVMGGTVLVVKAGSRSVSNLPQPVILTFKHNEKVKTTKTNKQKKPQLCQCCNCHNQLSSFLCNVCLR